MINKGEFEENLNERILTLNKTVWENKISGIKITNWLNNFKNGDEKIMALYLLSEFMYFGETQMKVLLKTLYRDLFRYPLIKKIRESKGHILDSKIIENEYAKKLRETRFLGIGNPSESGGHLLYFFRQENNLSKRNFINSFEIAKEDNKGVTKIVFLDDFCGSGSQATDKKYIEFIDEIKSLKKGIEIDYLMLVATSNGMQKVIDSNIFNDVNAVIKLDNSFKCFESDSRYLKNMNLPFTSTDIKDFARSHGVKLMLDFWFNYGIKDYEELQKKSFNDSLGFGDCQLLLGFNHNTPDNTLPIFWYDEQDFEWTPIFKRYNKKYSF
ncbi:hypothetical protein [Flavobacterium faecale]|uniref:phosphoribosyltransferase-like protein n=1 Tax=Flavobacterium faecale TaxID=1355330 RepID=UPI003AAF8000